MIINRELSRKTFYKRKQKPAFFFLKFMLNQAIHNIAAAREPG